MTRSHQAASAGEHSAVHITAYLMSIIICVGPAALLLVATEAIPCLDSEAASSHSVLSILSIACSTCKSCSLSDIMDVTSIATNIAHDSVSTVSSSTAQSSGTLNAYTNTLNYFSTGVNCLASGVSMWLWDHHQALASVSCFPRIVTCSGSTIIPLLSCSPSIGRGRSGC